MKLRLSFLLYLASLFGLAYSIWGVEKPSAIEFFSITTVISAVVMLPDLYEVGMSIFASSTRLNIVPRLVVRGIVAFGLATGTTLGLSWGMWGIIEIQAIALSLAVFSMGGLMLIKNYWRSYLL